MGAAIGFKDLSASSQKSNNVAHLRRIVEVLKGVQTGLVWFCVASSSYPSDESELVVHPIRANWQTLHFYAPLFGMGMSAAAKTCGSCDSTGLTAKQGSTAFPNRWKPYAPCGRVLSVESVVRR